MTTPTLTDPSILDSEEIARVLRVEVHKVSNVAGGSAQARRRPGTSCGPRRRSRLGDASSRNSRIRWSTCCWPLLLFPPSPGGWRGRGEWPVDALVIALIVIANAVLGFIQEAKAESAVAALAKMTAAASAVMRENGRSTAWASTNLVCGDILILSEVNAVGANGAPLAGGIPARAGGPSHGRK